jgi:hypothetical protein
VRRTFLVTLIAGVIALSGGIALYKRGPHEGGLNHQGGVGQDGQLAQPCAIWNEQRSGALT